MPVWPGGSKLKGHASDINTYQSGRHRPLTCSHAFFAFQMRAVVEAKRWKTWWKTKTGSSDILYSAQNCSDKDRARGTMQTGAATHREHYSCVSTNFFQLLFHVRRVDIDDLDGIINSHVDIGLSAIGVGWRPPAASAVGSTRLCRFRLPLNKTTC